jgi:hypothetical protein
MLWGMNELKKPRPERRIPREETSKLRYGKLKTDPPARIQLLSVASYLQAAEVV